MQDGNLMVGQPDIEIPKVDPIHQALQLHLADLFVRYGSPCLMVNLVRQHESRARETKIGGAFGLAIEFINQFLPTAHKIDYHGIFSFLFSPTYFN